MTGGVTTELRLIPVGKRTLRVTLAVTGDLPIPNEPVLAPRLWDEPVASLTAAAAPRRVAVAGMTVEIGGSAGAYVLAFASDEGIPQRIELAAADGSVTFDAGHGPLYGLGAGGPQQMDRKGGLFEPLNGQIKGEQEQYGARTHIPFLLSTDGWSLFFHRPFDATIDLRGPRGRFTAAEPLPLDLFLTFSSDPAVLLAEHAALVGPTPMPPKWALGYQQSHRTLVHDGQEQVLSTARTFREKRLPCDVLIYLGTGFCPAGWNTGHGSFEFNPVFGDPAETMRLLHRMHYKVILHVLDHPRHLHGSVNDRPAPGEPNHAASYWEKHRFLFGPDLEVDGFWPDEGDGDDIPARLARHRLYWEGPLAERPDRRPFSFHRNGYAGMQRWGGNVWSGDTYAWWRTLESHVPIALNASLSATLYWQSDTGGFFPTSELTGELYARWFQFSAFCAFFRSHGRTWHVRRPWGWGIGDLGPDESGTRYKGLPGLGNPAPEELHNEEVEPICRSYLELRYRLLPYVYSLAYEAWTRGLPLMRPLWLHFPEDPDAARCQDQYLWGPSMLIAPVTRKGAKSRDVYLPPGLWYDFWTRERLTGGRTIHRSVDIATMPIYIRAGSIIPMDPVREYVGQEVEGLRALEVYPGGDGSFLLYEDDGDSLGYQRGEGRGIRLTWDDPSGALTLTAEGAPLPGPVELLVRNAAGGSAVEVRFTGEELKVEI